MSRNYKALLDLALRRRLPGARLRDPRVFVRVILGLLLAANLVAAVMVFRPWGGSAEDLDRQLASTRAQLAQRQAGLERLHSLGFPNVDEVNFGATSPDRHQDLAQRSSPSPTILAIWRSLTPIDLNVLTRQCLCRRIGDGPALIAEVGAWETRRNQSQTGVDWQFTTANARVKLKRLYPRVQS